MWNHPLPFRSGQCQGLEYGPGRLQAPRCGWTCLVGLIGAGVVFAGAGLSWGQETAKSPVTDTPSAATANAKKAEATPGPDAPGTDAEPKKAPPFEVPKSWRRVTKDYEVWIDFSKKQVIVGGHICLREGMLEMFACPKGTKEHEAIVSVHSPARYVHAALVAAGAKPGPPVQFNPTYRPAQGTEITVEVLWKNTAGEAQRTRAQEWVKHVKTGEELKYPWVFAGSGFWTDEEGKEQFYYGDGGEFICVSNFSTATLDLPVESSAANDTLMFSAFKDRIPPLDTPVLLVLTPKLSEKGTEAAQESQKSDDKPTTVPNTEPKSEPATAPAKEAATPSEPKEPATDTPTEPSAPKPAEHDAPAKSHKEPSC